MAEAKWSGVLSTTEPRNDIGILNVRQGNLNSETVEFQIIQNNKPYDLTGMKVNFCANFGLSAVQHSAVIKDAPKGIIAFTFNDKSMQEVGRQIAYFQMTKDEVMVDSTQDFEFRIESSILSRKMEGGSYIESFENILEILGDNAAYELAEELLKTNELVTEKASLAYLDQVISMLGDGGPRGIYYSINALNSAYPGGTTGTWIVFDSTLTDGAHYFMWDVTYWKDMGPYNMSGLSLITIKQNEPWRID